MLDDYPETRFVRAGEVHIAYQVVGEGPASIVFASEWWLHLDALWDDPTVVRFLGRLASFGRLVVFDRRGFGLSDPLPTATPPTVEETMRDMLAVMDEVGLERATLVAAGDGAPPSILLAAAHPDRVDALVLFNAFARLSHAPDYRNGVPSDVQRSVLSDVEQRWGTEHPFGTVAPSTFGDVAFQKWFARVTRQSISRAAAIALTRLDYETDVRAALSSVHVPTAVLHRRDDRFVGIEHGRYIADHIDGASFRELRGADHLWWLGDVDDVLDSIEQCVTGEVRSRRSSGRVLASVLFTDIVQSTETAAARGDERWRRLLSAHDDAVRRQIRRYDGREINRTGDGFLVIFDVPTRAVRCAQAITAAVRPLGLTVRAGVHTGEVETREDGDLVGITIHAAARIAALACANEVLVSSIVKELVTGSGLEFTDRGRHTLKGIEPSWQLFLVLGSAPA
jgi:class 3 adenylate cyclase/pimeloyl-ACP methyl ester carboxylesterase